jgi:SAM-dependent methyltransferase
MVYLPEVPSTEEITKFYENYATFKLLTARRLPWFQLAKASFADRHIAILKQSGGLRDSSLVDIGCSFGRFLQLAKHCGAKVAGVELDDAARGSLQTLGIPCRKALNGDEKADIICAFQLIEHLENPGILLGQISKSLVDDGRLLLALPNGGEYEEVGESWLGFRVDLEHFNYFSVKTLSRLLAKFGLFVEQLWLHSQPAISRNVTKNPAAGLIPDRIWRTAQAVLRYPSGLEFYDNGTFVLTVLARKTPNQGG